MFTKTKGSGQPKLLQINIEYKTSTTYVQAESEPFQMNIFVIPEDLIVAIWELVWESSPFVLVLEH